MNPKAGIIIEYLWLSIAVIAFAIALYQWYNSDTENSTMFFGMVFISLLMFSFRRHLRKKQKTDD